MLKSPFLLPAVLLAAAALASCDGGEDPVPVGSFEVTVTGDVEGTASGTAFVAEPDSGLNAGKMEWQVDLPIAFETTAGDSVRVFFSVGEPVEPNGAFTEIPEGTFPFDVNDYDPTVPVPILAVRVTRGGNGISVGGTDGVATLRRRSDGAVEGTVRARYVAPSFGPTRRGSIKLRFTARPR